MDRRPAPILAFGAMLIAGAARGADATSTTRIHIETDRPVALDWRSADGEPWSLACESPCDRDLPRYGEYRIDGAGLRGSASFRLTAPEGATTTLRVRPATKTGFRIGQYVLGGGALFDFYGLVAVLATASAAGRSCGPDSPNGVYLTQDGSYTKCMADTQAAKNVRNAGYALLGVGVAATALGVYLLAANASTGVDERPAPTAPDRAPPPPIAESHEAPGEVHLSLVHLRF